MYPSGRGARVSDERRDYAILISLAMREEAEVMASALRADGIDAFVGNDYHANNDWWSTLAQGGLQVFVPRLKLVAARDAMRDRIALADVLPAQEQSRRRDRWKAWILALWYVFPWWIAVSVWLAGMMTAAWGGPDPIAIIGSPQPGDYHASPY
jgi:hypothetical protein